MDVRKGDTSVMLWFGCIGKEKVTRGKERNRKGKEEETRR